jgi:hypothetical protein
MHGIVFVTPFDADTRMVDRITGKLGFGHVALACGEIDRHGRPIVIDSSIAAGGVFRRPLKLVLRGAEFSVVEIDGIEEAYAHAATRIGEPYHFGSLLGRAPREGCSTCSHLVWTCLSPELREKVTPWRAGWCVSPNDLFRGLSEGAGSAESVGATAEPEGS